MDFDSGNKIINKTSHDASRSDRSLVKYDYNSARDTLVYGDYRSGFQVTSYKRFEAGLGANVLFFYENATGLSKILWASVGLIPYSGREFVSTRSANSLEDAYAKPALSIPLEAASLAKWTPGDNVTYASKGGIIFFAGPGVGPAALSTSYVATGIYQTYVEKVDNDNVIVRLTDIKVKTLNLQAGATLVATGTSKYRSVSNSFSYLINFKDAVGARAYNDLVRGNIAPIQKMVAQKSSPAVQKWDKVTRQQVGRLTQFSFGLPVVLNTSWSSGKIYELSKTQTFFDNTNTTVNYGIYLKDRRNRVLNKHSSMTEAFYGGVMKIKAIGAKSSTKAYFGQYSWSAEDDSTSHSDIRTDVNELIQKTGLQKELAVNIPSLKNLGFSSVALKMNLSEDMTFRLMKRVLTLSADEIGKKAQTKADKYFSSNADPLNLCGTTANSENFSSCVNTQTSLARQAGKGIFKAMASMEYHYKNNYDKEFALAYADFGKAVLTSPFVFQTVLDIAGDGLELEYIVNNTYFSSYHIKLSTTAQPGVFAKTLVPYYDFIALTPAASGSKAGVIVGPGVNPQVTP
ncbi:MAG: hypothetical protein KUL82_13975 [Bdellovibrio sp.]|nr:hypothetical protein [Bdellovibrio sp.]